MYNTSHLPAEDFLEKKFVPTVLQDINNTLLKIKTKLNGSPDPIQQELWEQQWYSLYTKITKMTEPLSSDFWQALDSLRGLKKDMPLAINLEKNKLDFISKSNDLSTDLSNLQSNDKLSLDSEENKTIEIKINELTEISSIIQLLLLKSTNQIINEAVLTANQFIKNNADLNKDINAVSEKASAIEVKLNKESQETTEFLSRKGLSKSFHKRSRDLKIAAWCWLSLIIALVFVIILSIKCHFSYMPMLNQINSENIDLHLKIYLLYLPIGLLSFWMLWLATKKHLYYARLADDYNFKNDISMAYFGYKAEIMSNELPEDNSIRLRLLDNMLAIITKNPVDTSSKNDGSPYTEILTKCINELKKGK